jgi:hypothetical protein
MKSKQLSFVPSTVTVSGRFTVKLPPWLYVVGRVILKVIEVDAPTRF